MNHTETLEIFTTGMTTDLRKVIRMNRHIYRPFQSLQHFDIYPDRLVPKRDWVLDTVATTNKLSRFTFFDDGLGSYTVWGLGVTGANKAVLLRKNSADPLAGAWVTPANNVTSSAAVSTPWIFGYKGYIYFPSANSLNRYNVATATLTEAWQTGTFSAPPVIHPRTGAAYFFSANTVYEVDPTSTWVGTVQVLPANMNIVSAINLGNNLAIGGAALSGYGNSTVYLWDLSVTSSPTSINFSESIDWGTGTLVHLANIRGSLVGVSQEQLDKNYAIGNGRVVVRVYSGAVAQETSYITVDSIVASPIYPVSFQDGNKLFFPASLPFKGDNRIGIWAVDGSGAFSIDATGPAAETGNRITSIYRLSKAWFAVFSDNSVYRLNDQASFTNTSVLETAIYGDRVNSTQFFGATVSFEKLLTGQSVTLYYKLPEDTVWTLMGTQATLGARQLQLLGTSLRKVPTWTEYQFRAESVGATLTCLAWTVEPFDTNIYG